MSSREPQYATLAGHPRISLGSMTSESWARDPRHLVFVLSRYKFVAKMLEGRGTVLEIGCGDAFASRLVRQSVGFLRVSDFDPSFVAEAQERRHDVLDIGGCDDAMVHDALSSPTQWRYDAIYALDVLEHIERKDEDRVVRNIRSSLDIGGVAIIGMPSLESQHLASPMSRAGHVNCKSAPQLKALMQTGFRSVFMFSMNDEVVHTGHHAMAHYLMAVCADPI